MATTTRSARITGPIPYLAKSGRQQHIPIGPCLVEDLGGSLVDIVWGAQGQRCAVLPAAEIEAAQDRGSLVLLD